MTPVRMHLYHWQKSQYIYSMLTKTMLHLRQKVTLRMAIVDKSTQIHISPGLGLGLGFHVISHIRQVYKLI